MILCLVVNFYRKVEKKSLSAEDHREKLKQSEFVQGIFCSTILDDGL